METVSVVIPARGRRRWLEESVASALAQTAPASEIIVVDDASAGGPPDIGGRAQGVDIRVIALSRRAGPAAARNAGWRSARGSWIAFLDSDDLWKPGKLARQLEEAGRAGARFCYCDFDVCDGEGAVAARGCLMSGGPLPRTYPIMAHKGFDAPYPRTSTVLMERSLLEECGGFDERFARLHDDTDLWLRVHERAPGSMLFLPEPLALYRLHEGQISRVLERLRSERSLDADSAPEVLMDDYAFWRKHLPEAASSR